MKYKLPVQKFAILGVFILLSPVFLGVSSGVFAQSVDEIEQEIQEKEQQKEQREADIENSKELERQAELEKLPLDQQLDAVQSDLDKTNKELENSIKQIETKEAEIDEKLDAIEKIRKIRNDQLLDVYIESRTRTLSMLFSGKTPADIIRGIIFQNTSIKLIASDLRKTQEKVDAIELEKSQLQAEKERLKAEQEKLDEQKTELEEQIQEIQAQIDAQNSLQASARNEISAIEKEISSLSAAAQAIINEKAGNQSESGGGSYGGGSGPNTPEGSPGTYDIYVGGTLVKANAQGPVTLSPTSGVRYEIGHRLYRGELTFRQDTDVNLINTLTVQNYLKGLGEMPSSWNREALKVQAAAARTYAYANWNKRTANYYNLLDNTYDQYYMGYGKELGAGSNWVAAVNETNNRVIKQNGQLITAWYHSTCGGHTISSAEKWGGTRSWAVGASDRYLSGGQLKSYDQSSPYYSKKWGGSAVNTSTLTDLVNAAIYLQQNNASSTAQNKLIFGQPGALSASDLQSALGGSSVQSKIGNITSASVVYDNGTSSLAVNSKHTNQFSVSGSGTITLPASYMKLAYNLRSPGTNYIASTLWNVRLEGGSWNFYSMGWGHRVGMCQYGAQGRAAAGQGYSQIISHYYNGSTPVNQAPPASNISIGITQVGGSSTSVKRDGSFDIYSAGSKIAGASANQEVRIVRK